jgi:hypothetical protein
MDSMSMGTKQTTPGTPAGGQDRWKCVLKLILRNHTILNCIDVAQNRVVLQ